MSPCNLSMTRPDLPVLACPIAEDHCDGSGVGDCSGDMTASSGQRNTFYAQSTYLSGSWKPLCLPFVLAPEDSAL